MDGQIEIFHAVNGILRTRNAYESDGIGKDDSIVLGGNLLLRDVKNDISGRNLFADGIEVEEDDVEPRFECPAEFTQSLDDPFFIPARRC